MSQITPLSNFAALAQLEPSKRETELRAVASEFEAVFLAEMLSHSGLGASKGEFSGGVGEDAFSSMMTRQWADKLASKGGIGLADKIYEAMVARGGSNV